MTFTDAKEVQVGEVVKGLLRADEIAVLRAVADRIVSNAHPEEDGRLDIAYAIARYLGLDWPAAQQPETRPVLSEPNRIGLYQGPDDCPQLMINDLPVAVFPAGTWVEVCDALDSITGSAQTDARGEAEYEYEVWQDGDVQAGGSAPDYASAKSEANRYAMMYNQDGPVEIIIYEKHRVAHARRSQRGKEVLS